MEDQKDFSYQKTQEKIQEILNECREGKYIFRGENRDDYGKVSSNLYREYYKDDQNGETPLINNHVLDLEKFIVKDAKHHIRPGASNIEVLTELQHHGGKTALIDFTRSLYIALFFACDGYFGKSGRIILFNTDGMEEKEEVDYEDEDYYTISPVGKAPRVVFQSGVFVRAPNGYIEKGKFKDIPIRDDLKQEILSYLSKYHDIKRDTIYNDIQGFIKNRENYYSQEAYYDRAIESNPKCAEAYYNRGVARLAWNEVRKAIEDFSKAIELDLKHVRAYHNIGLANVVLGKPEEGIKYYKKAMGIRPLPETYDALLCAEALGKDFDVP